VNLSLAVLADAANVSQEGKLNILGEFGAMWAAHLPVMWPSMQLVIRIDATAGEGPKHRIGIRILNEDGHPIAPPVDMDVDFGPPFRKGLPHRGQFVIGMVNAAFPNWGTYTFEILVDGHSVGGVPLHVLPLSERPPSA
jgi:uncharacterized protein DUF6941